MGISYPAITPEQRHLNNYIRSTWRSHQQVDVSVECEDSIEVEDGYALVKLNEANTIYKIIL